MVTVLPAGRKSEDAAGVDIHVVVIPAGQVVDADLVCTGGSVDELAAADVDAHVGDGLAAPVLEEHQVAGLQLALGHGHAVGQLAGGGAVEGVAEVAVDVGGEAGAVKAGGAVAAVDIGHAQVLLGVVHDLLAQAAAVRDGGGHGTVPPGAGGVLAGDHVLAAHIAGDAGAGGDLVPAAVDAHDADHVPVIQGGDLGVTGARPAAHIEGRAAGLYQAVADGHVGLFGDGQVLGGHVALHGLVVHLVPAVAGVLQDHHGVALGGGGQDGGRGAGLLPQAEGVHVHGAGPHGGGGGPHHAQGGEGDGEECGARELGRQYHW